MKPSLIILFITILLLCGALLRAAGISRKLIRIEKVKNQTKIVEVKKDMHFIPTVILL
jgi:hypothetical protein